MTREELLKNAKPILFNTEMVRATLDGRKTVTRRGIKEKKYYTWPPMNYDTPEDFLKDKGCLLKPSCDKADTELLKECLRPPYQPGCILYVRETFCALPVNEAGHMRGHDIFYYKADGDLRPKGWRGNWRPSIHMPKEAARIFLRVTDVRVERLKEISASQAMDEGFTDWNDLVRGWNNTIPKKDLDKYGWDANPWVWVIEFERIEAE